MTATVRDSELGAEADAAAVPGVVMVWSGATPRMEPLRVPGPGLVLGRGSLPDDDDRLSRQHARVRWDGDRFQVADLGSRNGTYVDGELLSGRERAVDAPAVVRVGRTVCLLVADLEPFVHAGPAAADGIVIGPTLRATWDAIEHAGRSGRTLLLSGESGVGKELAARAFHRAGAATGELIAVNCAAIPTGLAERLLFGARRGAYSGADRDVDGYLAAADGGTLFLDEVGELELPVQAKLLRVLETGELVALGAPRPRPVRLRVVAATLRDLRADVAAGSFRDDLYYRIGRPEVRVPALRDHREDVSWLCAEATAAVGLPAHPTLIEACLLRPWPGNVRELLGEVTRAAHSAVHAARPMVRTDDLDPRAGRPLTAPFDSALAIDPAALSLSKGRGGLRANGSPERGPGRAPAPASIAPAELPEHATILAALRQEAGNVSATARRLGVRRNQLRRYLGRHPDAAALVGGEAEDERDSSHPGVDGGADEG